MHHFSSMAEAKESKEDDGAGSKGEAKPANRVLELVEEFCMSNSMEREFDQFAADNAEVFVKCLTIDRGGVEEHPLEFHDVYTKYLRLFEAKIEAFIESKGFAIQDFYKQCQEIIDEDLVYGSSRFFVEALLATAEYEMFYVLMKGEMKMKFQHLLDRK